MAARARVKINMKPLERFKGQINRDLRRRSNGPVRKALRQWGHRYLGFTRERFVRMSRGGWAPLAASTIKARRKGAGSGTPAILRDTGTLFGALSPGTPGNRFKDIENGVSIGYGGRSSHPDGQATIADIARFHQTGAGNLPKREILVEPDRTTKARMLQDMRRAVREVMRREQLKT